MDTNLTDVILHIDEDLDNDGYASDVDCNDNDPAINPGEAELCDEVDHDCDNDHVSGGRDSG